MIHYYEADPFVLKEIKAGIEEEGCLYQTMSIEKDIDSLSLSYQASKQSSLGLGIGIHKDGAKISVRQQLEPVYIDIEEARPRRIGQNAARLIKGKPLR
jgi:hypothetical protein